MEEKFIKTFRVEKITATDVKMPNPEISGMHLGRVASTKGS